ncbi:MAG: alpha/beta hydrolase [Clostridia bacterium]|nr:alpha/beta hydrolase [Clostridia bacterium]
MGILRTGKILAGVIGAGSAAVGLVFYEVMNRRARAPKVIGDAWWKLHKAPDDASAVADENGELRDVRGEWFDKQDPQEIDIVSSRGMRLRGYLYPAEEHSDVFVFCAHGYRSTGKNEFRQYVKHYHDKGFNVLLVDHQAHGESEGTLISFGYYESRDSIDWLKYLIDIYGADIKIILHGVSMGAATVMMMSGSDDLPANVICTVSDCGFTTMKEEFSHNLTGAHVPPALLIPTTNVFNKALSGFDYEEVSPVDSVKHSKVPILFVHGAKDDFVPTGMVYSLYEACSAEKDLLIVEGADHAQSYATNPDLYDSKLDEFIGKYL